MDREIKKIKKRDGRIVTFDQEKITQVILKAAKASGEFGEEEARRLSDVVVNILIKLNGGQIPEVEQVQDAVESVLVAANHYPTAKAYILYRQKRIRLRQARQILGVSDDLKLPLNVLKVLGRRYLQHDEYGNPMETPLDMLKRVAKAVARAEKTKVERKKWEEAFLGVMTSFEFIPAGRYLCGAGTKSGQIANCFVLPVEDSMEGIFEAVKWTALVHKSGGGTGFNFSKLRPRGAKVGGGGFASGPVNFMKAFDAATDVVMRGGLYRGANMGVLNADHSDIFGFISAKEGGDLQNFNLSVGASDGFLRAVEKDNPWELINPHDREVIQRVSAKSLFNQITNLAWRTGDPGMLYLDRINEDNPLPALGPIEAVNVCGEQPLHPFDVCNLGSLDLAKFIVPEAADFKKLQSCKLAKALNWNRLEEVVRRAIRFLDNGVDVGRYPLRQITKMARTNRRVGLGVMGFADLLYQLMIPYDSKLGIKAAEKIMGFVNQVASDESKRLAGEKGVFPNWEISIFKDKGTQRRNCAVTTIAPTGSISMIADTSSGIEPVFALAYVKDVVEESGLFYVNKYFQKALEEFNLFSFELIREITRTGSIKQSTTLPEFVRQVFVTAHDISWEWHVQMQAAFQRFTENGVSKTINLPYTATVDEVAQAYLLAWKLGCKGITVYRDKCKAEQILKVGSGESSGEGRERIQTKLTITPLKKANRHSGGIKCLECDPS